MREPDYAQMKHMLAQREAESASYKELYEIMLRGHTGWESYTDEHVLDTFLNVFGQHEIPKKKVEVK